MPISRHDILAGAIIVLMLSASAPVATAPASCASRNCPATANTAPVDLSGLSLAMTRAELADRLAPLSVERQTSRNYQNGAEESRIWLKDGSFIRISWPDKEPASRPVAIIYNTKATGWTRALPGKLGAPDWKSTPSPDPERVVWGGRGTAEDGVLPRADRDQIVALAKGPEASVTITLARPSWFTQRR